MTESRELSRVANNNDYFVRKADLDDVEALTRLINEDNRLDLNQLFDYPKLTALFER
jgi:hypothetical protein